MTVEHTREKPAKRLPQEILKEVQAYVENDLPDAAKFVAFNDFIALFERRMTVETSLWQLDELNQKNWFQRQTRRNRRWEQRFNRELRVSELHFTQLDTAIQLERNRSPAYGEAFRTINTSFEQLVHALNGRPFHMSGSIFLVGDVGGLLGAQDRFEKLQTHLRQRNNQQKPLR